MGWKENGKFGVTTGRTVRSPFASSPNCFRGKEMVLKFTRGTGDLSGDELQDFLKENDIDDGLGDFNEFTTRLMRVQGVDRSCDVPYSLKKRKRWQLEENVKRIEDTKQTAPNVTFIHRRVDRNLTADCFEVVRAKAGEVLQPIRRKYAKAQDLLKRSDKAELEPEVCYEMTYRYPRNEYPQYKEVQHRWRYFSGRFDAAPGKALCKSKSVKNKGRRWGLYSDADLRSGHITEKKPVLQQNSQQNTPGGKVQVIDLTAFRKCDDFEESSPFCGTLDLGLYMLESSKTLRKQTTKNKHNPNLTLSTIKDSSLRHNLKDGKNSVVYIEQEPEEKSSADLSSSATEKITEAPTCQMFQPENKTLATVPVYVSDLKPNSLEEKWGCLYSEANSFPRKFTIDLMPALYERNNENIEFCFVLFEVIMEASSAMVSVETNVSLNIVEAEDSDTFICSANGKFCSGLQTHGIQEAWRVQYVVDCALECLHSLVPSLQFPTRKTTSHCQKTWRSLQVLDDLFGWKSELFTPKQMKTELLKKIKKHEKSFLHKNDTDHCITPDDFNTVETLGISDCGICCNELGE